MSGAGRRSGYRKGVTDGFLNEMPLPKEGESIVAKIGSSRGANVFEVILPSGAQSLALLPNKFKKVIWVKRNDFVLITSASDESTVFEQASETAALMTLGATPSAAPSSTKEAKIQHQIEFILGKDQIKNIRDNNLWPAEFEGKGVKGDSSRRAQDDIMPDYEEEDADESEYDESDIRYDKFGNTIEPGTEEWLVIIKAELEAEGALVGVDATEEEKEEGLAA
jgi:probable RNA-binding protein EIF1AD